MISLSSVYNRVHRFLKENMEESAKENFDFAQVLLFMGIGEGREMNKDLYDISLELYNEDKAFKRSIDKCLKHLKETYKNEKLTLKDGSVVNASQHFDKVYKKFNTKEEEMTF